MGKRLDARRLKKRAEENKNFVGGLDFHTKITLSFYPYDNLLQNYLVLPSLYISSGILEFNIDDTVVSSKTQGGIVFDDWGILRGTINARDIVAVFDAKEVARTTIFGIERRSEKYITERDLAKNLQSLNDLFSMITKMGNETELDDGAKLKERRDARRERNQSYKFHHDYLKSLANAGAARDLTMWKNRGLHLLDKSLLFYKSNGTLFDNMNIPVLSGNVVIETDYMWSGDPKEFRIDYSEYEGTAFKRFLRNSVPRGIKSFKTFEEEQQNLLVSGANPDFYYPNSIYYGKFNSFTFNLMQPYSSKINFNFNIIGNRTNIISPDEITSSARQLKKKKPQVSGKTQEFIPEVPGNVSPKDKPTFELTDTSARIY